MNESAELYSSDAILFNTWKHHRGFIVEQIKRVKCDNDFTLIRTNLLRIGESQMDLYTGKLQPEEITAQINLFLQSENLLQKEDYEHWLSTQFNKEYSLQTLSDSSTWTLRLRNDNEKFVHIHPARYSPLSSRIKATVLKTGIILFCYLNFNNDSYNDVKLINQLRKEYLNEPPLKALDNKKGLGKFLNFLNEYYYSILP